MEKAPQVSENIALQNIKRGASMPFYWILSDIRKLRRGFLEAVLPLLEKEAIEREFTGFTRRKRVYHTWPLFVMFLSQVVTREPCRKEVAQAISCRLVPPRTKGGTSAYCNARARLPEKPLMKLAFKVGKKLAEKAGGGELFFNRRVKVVDGSSAQLPDTPANQSEYPQPSAQKTGCGIPVMYFSALMDLATGAILRVVATGGAGYERRLFRRLMYSLRKNDIILGDSAYMSFADIAMLLRRGVDCVFRWNNARKHRMAGAVRLGEEDWLETWEKPKYPGSWDPEMLPETVTVRVILFICEIGGFRPKTIKLVTTLTDPKRYPKDELMKLYARRWEMELRLNDIKTTMRLGQLTCKTPDRCRKELWMGLLAYNLIRTIMLHAARRAKLEIARISFAGTRDRIDAFGLSAFARDDPADTYRLLLDHIAADPVPFRPFRSEPRKVKRRWTRHSLLTEPRNAARHALSSS